MSTPVMTPEQVEAALRALGAEQGQWKDLPGGLRPSLLGLNPEGIVKLRTAVEKLVAGDQQTVARLKSGSRNTSRGATAAPQARVIPIKS